MKRSYLSTASVVTLVPLALITLQSCGIVRAVEAFTKVTAGPGSDGGRGEASKSAAWGDYNNDGFIDLFVSRSGLDPLASASHFLYHNNGDGTFNRVTVGPIGAVESAGAGAAWGDYDNDGHLDLVHGNVLQPNSLFHNDGNGSFTLDPGKAIASDIAGSRRVTWVDYDNDGYLDLYRTVGIPHVQNVPQRLYHNNQDGTFTRITQGSFLTMPGGFFDVAWGDYNNDGRPDLFQPNADEENGHPSHLYRNDGDGTFTRVGVETFDGSFSSNHAAWGDYDNDGDLDLFVSRAVPPGEESRPNFLYRNNGDGTFTGLDSLPAKDPEYQGGVSRGGNWGDYDNDGWLDLYVVNRLGQNNFLYHNNGDGTFSKVLDSIAVKEGGDSWSTSWGDYDNDGFLDLFVGNFDGSNFLYHNNRNDHHWLKFRLIGTRSNRAAIGAKVRVRATIHGQTFWQMREVTGGENSPHVHVGLGAATNADLVRIEWPSGTVQEFANVASKQFLTVTEPPSLTLRAGVLRIQSWKGMAFEVQASTDLDQWSPVTTMTNLTGTLQFTDPNAANDSRRFYRAELR